MKSDIFSFIDCFQCIRAIDFLRQTCLKMFTAKSCHRIYWHDIHAKMDEFFVCHFSTFARVVISSCDTDIVVHPLWFAIAIWNLAFYTNKEEKRSPPKSWIFDDIFCSHFSDDLMCELWKIRSASVENSTKQNWFQLVFVFLCVWLLKRLLFYFAPDARNKSHSTRATARNKSFD